MEAISVPARLEDGRNNPEYHRQYWLLTRDKRMSGWAEKVKKIRAVKLGAGCADCGYRERPEALQFDHVGSDKEFDICSSGSRSWDSLKTEMDKCEVVCANCHAVRTADRRQRG